MILALFPNFLFIIGILLIDRLIIAQAITNNLSIIGVDKAFADYAVKMIW